MSNVAPSVPTVELSCSRNQLFTDGTITWLRIAGEVVLLRAMYGAYEMSQNASRRELTVSEVVTLEHTRNALPRCSRSDIL